MVWQAWQKEVKNFRVSVSMCRPVCRSIRSDIFGVRGGHDPEKGTASCVGISGAPV